MEGSIAAAAASRPYSAPICLGYRVSLWGQPGKVGVFRAEVEPEEAVGLPQGRLGLFRLFRPGKDKTQVPIALR